MPIKNYKPNRAARKKMSIVDRSGLHKGSPNKKLTQGRNKISGRGKAGKITIRHRGAGVKRKQRLIDWKFDKLNVPAKVESVEFDPNLSANIVLVCYQDGERRYHLAWSGAAVGQEIMVGPEAPEKPGNRLPLSKITPGAIISNVELKPGRGAALARAAGSGLVLMDVKGKYAQVKMNSGEVRLLPAEVYATVGQTSNSDWRLQRIGSAGRSRRLGRRPQVRGKVMNPVDHPHGGGEGNQSIGLKHPKTPWGKPALGVKTRKKGKYSDHFILERRKNKKKK